CLGEYITEETGFPYPSGGDIDHITVLPHDNEVPRPTSHLQKMVEQLILLYDNREEGKKRAESAFKMVSNNLFWKDHVNPRWIDIFDKIVKESRIATVESSVDASTSVFKGEMV
ncbi:unnamed protein product, partial [marine sediment metagenome]